MFLALFSSIGHCAPPQKLAAMKKLSRAPILSSIFAASSRPRFPPPRHQFKGRRDVGEFLYARADRRDVGCGLRAQRRRQSRKARLIPIDAIRTNDVVEYPSLFVEALHGRCRHTVGSGCRRCTGIERGKIGQGIRIRRARRGRRRRLREAPTSALARPACRQQQRRARSRFERKYDGRWSWASSVASGDVRLVSAPGGIAGASAVTKRATASTPRRFERVAGMIVRRVGVGKSRDHARRSTTDEFAVRRKTRPASTRPAAEGAGTG